MRILGVDPGSRVAGYGIIDGGLRNSTCVAAGVLRADGADIAARLGGIQAELAELIRQHQPEMLAIEKVFVGRNIASALMLGQSRGALLACCGQAGLGLAEYSASQIKKAVVGNGRASKEQVRHMVGILLKMDASQQELDCTDALAVALCHAHSAPLAARTGMPAGARWSRRSQRSSR